MRAFILRRLALINAGYGNAILMGSRHSAQTLELREFLSRNGYPYTYVDLDTDQTSQALLDRFNVKPVRSAGGDLPRAQCAAQPVDSGTGQLPGFQRQHRSARRCAM